MCFRYITQHGLKINQMYELGFSRVGCCPCVLARKREIVLIAEYFPEQILRIKRLEEKLKQSFFLSKKTKQKGGKLNITAQQIKQRRRYTKMIFEPENLKSKECLKEYKIIKGDIVELQRLLNHWRHVYDLNILHAYCNTRNESIIILTRIKKEKG